jgi:hypothetical protein
MVCAVPKILVGMGALHLSFPLPVKFAERNVDGTEGIMTP